MAQWIGIGLAGINRARRAPARVHKRLRDRWPFRRREKSPEPRPGPDSGDGRDTSGG
jgi:hypothetical protein